MFLELLTLYVSVQTLSLPAPEMWINCDILSNKADLYPIIKTPLFSSGQEFLTLSFYYRIQW